MNLCTRLDCQISEMFKINMCHKYLKRHLVETSFLNWCLVQNHTLRKLVMKGNAWNRPSLLLLFVIV